MNNRRRFLFAFFALTWIVFETRAQENPYNEVSIASPTAASLGKYADIPVNNHTGIPSISIPIYTVQEGSLQLPISLSYHAGGIKVMETASWVGAGWSLNASGVITRSVSGAPDEEFTSSTYNQQYGYFSDYGYTSYSFYQLGTTELDEFLEGKRDGQPDLFNFNVGGLSGKFYFRDDRTPVFEPQQDIKIEYDYTAGQGSIKSFVLIAPEGTRYYFGVRNDENYATPVERTNCVTSSQGYVEGTVISSWYLSKIESADRLDFITLNYTSENYSYYTISMFPVSSDDNRMNSAGSISQAIPQPYEYNLIKNVVEGVRLSNITFSNGKVTFNAGDARQDLGNYSTNFDPEVVNTEAKSLSSIQIENNGSVCKKYVFTYDYFTDNSALQGYFAGYTVFTDKKRLKLNTVQEFSCDNAVSAPAHSFVYFSEPLPRRLSFGQDHWGFYNGAVTNTKLIPTYTENNWTEFPGANRDAAWPAMRGGALKKIVYPSGGFSEFEFEANDTWSESTRYNSVAGPIVSVGFSNQDPDNEEFHTLNNAAYTIVLTNGSNPSGGVAMVNVYDYEDQQHPLVATLTANVGESKQLTVTLPHSGSYRVYLVKDPVPSGDGASASFYEKVAYTYARNEIVGGLRIKTLTHNDGSFSPDMVTSYSYLKDSVHSSGVLYSRPVYVQIVRSDEIKETGGAGPYGNGPVVNTCNPEGCIDCNSGSSLRYYKSPCGIRPLSTSQGNHIGYNQVKITKAGNGYSIYKYYGSEKWDAIIDDIAIRNINTVPPCTLSIPSYPFPPEPLEPKRGELKYEVHFREDGQRIKEADYTLVFAEEITTTPGRIDGTFGTWRFSTYYDLRPIRKTSQTIVEKLYTSPTTYIMTTSSTYFESLFHNQATRKSTVNSKGELIESKYKYAADFRNTSCDIISDCFNSYYTSIGIISSQYSQAKAACTTDGCIYNAYLAYRAALALARRNYLTCRQDYSNPANQSGFVYCRNTSKSNAGSELKPIYELQEQNDFTPIEMSEWKAGKLIKAIFNRFDYVTNPSGKVYLNKIQTINLKAPSTTFTPSSVNGNTIVKDTRYEDETFLKFEAGNLVELKKRDGVVNSYIWGYHSKFPVAKIANASYDVAKNYVTPSILTSPTTDAALRTDLANLRSNLPNALVSTYTYKPLAGISSETDARGRTIYYEYDALNRLVLIRDHDNNIIKKVEYQFQATTQQ